MIEGKNACSSMKAANGGDGAIDFVGGGAVAVGDGLHAPGDEREHPAEQGAIQSLLALEVVVEHRLVDAGAAGDAVDAGAGEAARGEFDRGGGEDGVRGDAGGARHTETNRLVN